MEIKLVAIETEEAVEGDLADILQTRKRITSNLRFRNKWRVSCKVVRRLLATQLSLNSLMGIRMTA